MIFSLTKCLEMAMATLARNRLWNNIFQRYSKLALERVNDLHSAKDIPNTKDLIM